MPNSAPVEKGETRKKKKKKKREHAEQRPRLISAVRCFSFRFLGGSKLSVCCGILPVLLEGAGRGGRKCDEFFFGGRVSLWRISFAGGILSERVSSSSFLR